jgi:hypothetical protein
LISDRNRRRIQGILDELKVKEDRNPPMVAFLTEELLDLIDMEGLNAQLGDFFPILMQVHMEMGDFDKAREYGKMALEKQTHFKGIDSEPAERTEAILKRMETFQFG